MEKGGSRAGSGSLGCSTYVATNAVGGTDHLSSPEMRWCCSTTIKTGWGANPLRGPDTPEWNPRFPDMTHAYDRQFLASAERAAEAEGILVKRGVYIAFPGPSFETPAEIRMARILGGTVVGMSTVPEVITANAMGMRVCAVSCVANYAAGMTENRLTGEEVLEEMAKASDKLIRLLKRFFSEMD